MVRHMVWWKRYAAEGMRRRRRLQELSPLKLRCTRVCHRNGSTTTLEEGSTPYIEEW